MKCLILAAGYATRLYPLTENFPKPLLKVKDKTILDWLINDIESSDMVDEYVVISNHRYFEHFRKWAASRNEKITVLDDGTTENSNRLGAVRDIQLAVEELNLNDDLLVIAGDNLLDFSLVSFIDYAKKKNRTCIMRYFEEDMEKLKKCGVVLTEKDDRILDMEEKPCNPKSNWCCPPFYYYKSSDVGYVREAIEGKECGTDAPGSFIAWLSKKTDVYSMIMPGKRYDIGNLESYRKVQEEYEGY